MIDESVVARVVMEAVRRGRKRLWLRKVLSGVTVGVLVAAGLTGALVARAVRPPGRPAASTSTTQPSVGYVEPAAWFEAPAGRWTSVVCTSTSFCMAFQRNPSSFWVWTGTSWRQVPVEAAAPADSPTPSGDGRVAGAFESMACTSSSFCLMVGVDENTPAAYVWRGSVWRSAVEGMSRVQGRIDGLSCVSASWCIGVGADESGALIERWNGHRWSEMANPLSRIPNSLGYTGTNVEGSGLDAVSCPTERFCAATGDMGDLGARGALRDTEALGVLPGAVPKEGQWTTITPIETWNGRSWSSLALPVPLKKVLLHSNSGDLETMNCLSASLCIATGNDVAENKVLVDTWNGLRWTAGVGPSGNGDIEPYLSCVGSSWCLALFGDPERARLPTERFAAYAWDGSAWQALAPLVVSVPRRETASMNSLLCFSTRACVASGGSLTRLFLPCAREPSADIRAAWDGSAWHSRTIPSPPPPPEPNGCR